MKPIYLEFNGLNSFSSTAKIDFTKLLQGGVFGVFGATGSGKSSILDAIHFALYGTVDRASETDCINHNSDKMSVIFEFEILQDGRENAIVSSGNAVGKTERPRRIYTKLSAIKCLP